MKFVADFPGGGVVVVGGASGLGRATAEALKSRSVPVTIIDLPAACQQLKHDLDFLVLGADVTDQASVDAAFAEHASQRGACRALINCAGVIGGGMLFGREQPLDGDAFRRVIDINLVGSFLCIRAAAAQMRAAEPGPDGLRGIIINTASIAAFDGTAGQAAYAASKGGVASMTLPLARELARSGIRVMAIAPGVFSTPMIHGLDDRTREAVSNMLPLFPPRLGEPKEFAEFVLSVMDNSLLNGEVIRFDGGLRMGHG